MVQAAELCSVEDDDVEMALAHCLTVTDAVVVVAGRIGETQLDLSKFSGDGVVVTGVRLGGAGE